MAKPGAVNQFGRGGAVQFQARPQAQTTVQEAPPSSSNSSAPRFGTTEYPDAAVEISSQGGHGQGKGKGLNRDNGGFKNHGQMVKAAREAGYSGRDLAAVAKGETRVEPDGLAAISSGDLTIDQYRKAQEGVAKGDFTLDQFQGGLERVTSGEVSFGDLIKELTTPAPVEEVAEGAAPVAAASTTESAEAPPAPSTEPAPLTLSSSNSNAAPAEGMNLLRMRGFRFGR